MRFILPFALALAVITSTAPTASADQLPNLGCPAAHCDPQLSDNSGMEIPKNPTLIPVDTHSGGALFGLGCVSDGERIVVCSNNNPNRAIRAFTADGLPLWDSRNLLNERSYTSAPLVLEDGSTIAADNERMIRFDRRGRVLWTSELSGESPISPVWLDRSRLFLATKGGEVATFDSATGARRATLELQATDQLTGNLSTYVTVNTPCIQGNRAYVLTESKSSESQSGRLFALDLSLPSQIRVAWSFPFLKDSGASPTCIGDSVYFDGNDGRPEAPHTAFFALKDLGASYRLRWARQTPGKMQASVAFAAGKLWGYTLRHTELFSFDLATGAAQRFDLPAITGIPNSSLASAVTVARWYGRPVLIATATEEWMNGKPHAVAIDVLQAAPQLVWKVQLGRIPYATINPGQWPLIKDSSGRTRIVFNTVTGGIFALVEK